MRDEKQSKDRNEKDGVRDWETKKRRKGERYKR